MTYDTIVVGAGAMGSAAAYHLARRGQRVLILDQFAEGHENGSSHGITRIIRLAYFEHPSYVPLLSRAFELWRDLQDEAGEQLLTTTGSLDAGPVGSRTVTGSLHSCQLHGLDHELLTSAEISSRFPAYHLPESHVAVLQPAGGFLIPERCIHHHLRSAQHLGAVLHTNARVHTWTATSQGGIAVESDAGTFHAGHLVLAAGAWIGTLAPQLAHLFQPERQLLGWFGIDQPAHFAPARFPVFNLDYEHEHWYGFPEFGVRGFKVGCYHHRREHVDPDAFDRTRCDDADIALLRQLTTNCFPEANGALLRAKSCMFTNTPDEHFVLDHLPGFPQVAVIAPCSGHGFKFASVMGEIAADLVCEGSTRHDIALHRLSRFGVSPH